MTQNQKSITILLEELEAAQEVMANASANLSRANNQECSASNGLNAAQQAIDLWYETQRKSAPRNSNWWSSRNGR